MRQPATLALLLLTGFLSVGALSKYPDNEMKQFDKCLSEADRQEIARSGVLYKVWDGIYKTEGYAKGLLQIRADTQRKGQYHFIKNGPWVEYHRTFKGERMKLREIYDRFGNRISSKIYLSPADTTQGFKLRTEETLDSVSLTATYKQYYDNGQLKYIMFGRPLNYSDFISSPYKQMVTDSMKAFAPTGAEINPEKIDTYNAVYYKPTQCR